MKTIDLAPWQQFLLEKATLSEGCHFSPEEGTCFLRTVLTAFGESLESPQNGSAS